MKKIRIKKKEFETIVKARGYTWDEIVDCIALVEGEWLEIDEHHKAYPQSGGLGDMVKSGLEAVGITEDRVKKATGKRECGCARRRASLNRFGRKIGIGKKRG